MKESIKSRNKLTINQMDFCVGLYIFSILLADGTYLFYASACLLCLVGYLNLIYRNKWKINAYILLMICFILYNAFSILLGVPLYKDVAIKRLMTMVVNFLVNYIVFDYFVYSSHRYKMMRWFVNVTWILIAYIIIFNFSSLLLGRFGQDTRYFLGLIGTNGYGYNSNLICRIIYIALVFTCFSHFSDEQNQNSRLFYIEVFLLLLFIMMTGSRSGLIISMSFVIIFYLLKTKNISSKVKYIFGGLLLITIAYFAIMKVEFLYSIIGNRVEVLINGLLAGGEFEERSSVFFRGDMIEMGLAFFKERPIWGWGLDNFSKMSIYGTYSHSNFIELLVSCGIFGFFIYYIGYLFLLWKSYKNIKYKEVRIEASMIFSLLLPLLIMNVATVNYLDRISLFFFYLSAGAIYEWSHYINKENE